MPKNIHSGSCSKPYIWANKNKPDKSNLVEICPRMYNPDSDLDSDLIRYYDRSEKKVFRKFHLQIPCDYLTN
jgi:hypothetical protein